MHSLFKKITFDCLKRRLILSTKILTFKWEPKTYLLPTHFSCSRTQTLNTVLIQHAKGWQLFSLLSRVWLFASPWTNLLQAPLSMGFPRQEYWAGCHSLLQGIFPNQGSNPCLLHWQVDSLPLKHQGSLDNSLYLLIPDTQSIPSSPWLPEVYSLHRSLLIK